MVDEDFAFQVESRLTSHGVYVREVSRDRGDTDEGGDGTARYRVEYESMAATDGAIPHREVGRVINVFRDLHPENWRGAEIEGVVLDLDGEELGRWSVEAEWIRALHDDELTEIEFSEKVIDSIER